MSWQGTGWASKQKTGSAQMKNVLMILGNCASPEGVVYAKQQTLEEETELEQKALRRNIKNLMQRGFLRVFERRTPAGHRNSNVIVLMVEEQWHQRTESPLACNEYFAGHKVKERWTDAQQNVFKEQQLPHYGRKVRGADCPPGQNDPGQGTKCPVGPEVAEISKSLNEEEKPGPTDSLSGRQTVDKIDSNKSLEKDARGRADDRSGGNQKERIEKPSTLKAWWEGHRSLLEETLGKPVFKAWMTQLICAADEGGKVTFWAPSRFIAEHVERHYGHVLCRVLDRQEILVHQDRRASMHNKRQAEREKFAGSVTLAPHDGDQSA